MFHPATLQKPTETRYLDDILDDLARNEALRDRADAVLQGIEATEPLFADSLRTPQSAPYHGEGPFLRDHLRAMLGVLFAVVERDFSLLEIEELRRLKGYEGEIKDLEFRMREHAAFFEVYIVAHDAAKWATVFFEAMEGSRGEILGLSMHDMDKRDPIGDSERAKLRERYLDLYDRFAADYHNESDQSVQAKFFSAYGIRVRYPGHDRGIFSPLYRDFLHRLAEAHRLTDLDIRKVEDMISVHLDVGHDFAELDVTRMGRYYKLAQSRGYDSDEFIDFLQIALFLDFVCGSAHTSPHGVWHDMTPILNFLQAEHNFEPQRRLEKEAAREDREMRRRNRLFREVGLDGVSLMELFGMEPGPKFGAALARIHEAILGRAEMPKFPSKKIEKEMEKRIRAYYERAFEKDAADA